METKVAVQLILSTNSSSEGDKAHFALCDEGRGILQAIGDGPVSVISICGPSKTGKSFLLSRIGAPLKFEVGSSLESVTRGIAVASVPQTTRDGENCHLVLLDTEGSNSLNGTSDLDGKLFGINYLVSSLILYNCLKRPERTNILNLKSMYDVGNSFHDSENRPKLAWVLRDVTAKGSTSNVMDHINKTLSGAKDGSQLVEGIKSKFETTEVFTLPSPSVFVDVCENLDSPDSIKQTATFQKEVNDLVGNILSSLTIKRFAGQNLTGNRLCQVLDTIIETCNNADVDIVSYDTYLAEYVLQKEGNRVLHNTVYELATDPSAVNALNNTGLQEVAIEHQRGGNMRRLIFCAEKISKVMESLASRITLNNLTIVFKIGITVLAIYLIIVYVVPMMPSIPATKAFLQLLGKSMKTVGGAGVQKGVTLAKFVLKAAGHIFENYLTEEVLQKAHYLSGGKITQVVFYCKLFCWVLGKIVSFLSTGDVIGLEDRFPIGSLSIYS